MSYTAGMRKLRRNEWFSAEEREGMERGLKRAANSTEYTGPNSSSDHELSGLRNIAVSIAWDPLTPLCVLGDERLERMTAELRGWIDRT